MAKKREYSRWDEEEENALRTGVAKYGEGKWKRILADPALIKWLDGRTNVDLKDKWRTMACAEAGRATRPGSAGSRPRGAQTAAQALAMKRRAAQALQHRMRGNPARQAAILGAVNGLAEADLGDGFEDDGGTEEGAIGAAVGEGDELDLLEGAGRGAGGAAHAKGKKSNPVLKAKAKAAGAHHAAGSAKRKASALQARLAGKPGGRKSRDLSSPGVGGGFGLASPRSQPPSPAAALSKDEDALLSALIAARRRSQQLEVGQGGGGAGGGKGDERRRRWAQAEPLLEVWKAIASHRSAAPFRRGVPEGELVDYSLTVQRPTDLSSIRRRLEGKAGPIPNPPELHRDLLLMIHNALVMSPEPDSALHVAARELRLHVFRQMEILHVSNGGSSQEFREEHLVRGRFSPPELPPPLPEGIGARGGEGGGGARGGDGGDAGRAEAGAAAGPGPGSEPKKKKSLASAVSPGSGERVKRKAAALADGALNERTVAAALQRKQVAADRELEAVAARAKEKQRKEREAQRERERERRLAAAAAAAAAAAEREQGAEAELPEWGEGEDGSRRSAMPAKKRWLQTAADEGSGEGARPSGKGPPLHWGSNGTRQRSSKPHSRRASGSRDNTDVLLAEDEEEAAMQLMCMFSGGADSGSGGGSEEDKPEVEAEAAGPAPGGGGKPPAIKPPRKRHAAGGGVARHAAGGGASPEPSENEAGREAPEAGSVPNVSHIQRAAPVPAPPPEAAPAGEARGGEVGPALGGPEPADPAPAPAPESEAGPIPAAAAAATDKPPTTAPAEPTPTPIATAADPIVTSPDIPEETEMAGADAGADAEAAAGAGAGDAEAPPAPAAAPSASPLMGQLSKLMSGAGGAGRRAEERAGAVLAPPPAQPKEEDKAVLAPPPAQPKEEDKAVGGSTPSPSDEPGGWGHEAGVGRFHYRAPGEFESMMIVGEAAQVGGAEVQERAMDLPKPVAPLHV